MRGLAEPGAAPIDLECLPGKPVVIPYESLGVNTRYALAATEVPEESSNALAAIVSRRVSCKEEKPLHREINEIRTKIQLERRYPKQALFTMMANSAYFGEGTVGIEAASLHYFRKHSQELRIEEAALLAGLISRPAFYSATSHPDRALKRRNQVIDAMVHNGVISPTDASVAETAPVLVVSSFHKE